MVTFFLLVAFIVFILLCVGALSSDKGVSDTCRWILIVGLMFCLGPVGWGILAASFFYFYFVKQPGN